MGTLHLLDLLSFNVRSHIWIQLSGDASMWGIIPLGLESLQQVLSIGICFLCKACVFIMSYLSSISKHLTGEVEQGKKDRERSKVLTLTKYNNDATWVKIKAIVSKVGEEESKRTERRAYYIFYHIIMFALCVIYVDCVIVFHSFSIKYTYRFDNLTKSLFVDIDIFYFWFSPKQNKWKIAKNLHDGHKQHTISCHQWHQ